ncbi:tetratricopeptide repeat protein [Cystoisospora suis]|uniref:Tetratricopeptide repeat protein n=1 Tax=Cystoisospora suis TaxID=483139 RepID=A0A2C6L7E5_9APIC|nr:tetratricopeptide repeat protein [Cystoisospora suis]
MAGMAIQTQIRHNAEEIRSYFEDLKKWEEEMKKKDKVARELRKADGGASHPCKGPEPCKGSQVAKANKAPDIEPREPSKKTPQACEGRKKLARDENTLPAYYAAWDKFSVDDELKKIDEAEENEGTEVKSSGLITAPPVAIQKGECLAKVTKEHQQTRSKMKVQARVRTAVNIASSEVPRKEEEAVLLEEAEKACQQALTHNSLGLRHYRTGSSRSAVKCFGLALDELSKKTPSCPESPSSSSVQPRSLILDHYKKLRSVFLSNQAFAQLTLSRVSVALEQEKAAQSAWSESPLVPFLHAACMRREGRINDALDALESLESELAQGYHETGGPSRETETTDQSTHRSSACESAVATRSEQTEENFLGRSFMVRTLQALATRDFSWLSQNIAICRTPARERQLTVAPTTVTVNPGVGPRSEPSPVTFGSVTSLADHLGEELRDLRAIQKVHRLDMRRDRQRRSYEESVDLLRRMQLIKLQQSSASIRAYAHEDSRSKRKEGEGKGRQNKQMHGERSAELDRVARRLASTPSRRLIIQTLRAECPGAEPGCQETLAKNGAASPMCKPRNREGTDSSPNRENVGDSAAENTESTTTHGIYNSSEPEVKENPGHHAQEKDQRGKWKHTSRTPCLPQTFFAFLRQWKAKCSHSSRTHSLQRPQLDPATSTRSRRDAARTTSPQASSHPQEPRRLQRGQQQQMNGTRGGEGGQGDGKALAISSRTAKAGAGLGGRVAEESPGTKASSDPRGTMVTSDCFTPPLSALPLNQEAGCPACVAGRGALLEQLAAAGLVRKIFKVSLEADILSEITQVLTRLFVTVLQDTRTAERQIEDHLKYESTLPDSCDRGVDRTRANSHGNGGRSEPAGDSVQTRLKGQLPVERQANEKETMASRVRKESLSEAEWHLTHWTKRRVATVTAEVLAQLNQSEGRTWTILFQLAPDELQGLNNLIRLSLENTDPPVACSSCGSLSDDRKTRQQEGNSSFPSLQSHESQTESGEEDALWRERRKTLQDLLSQISSLGVE